MCIRDSYTTLTIGDGLVSQIPALIVSTAAGLLVTKAGVKGSADKAVVGQLGKFPAAIGLTALLLLAMTAMPGIPAPPFLFLATVVGGVAFFVHRNPEAGQAYLNEVNEKIAGGAPSGGGAALGGDGLPALAGPDGQPAEAEEDISEALKLDVLRLELGYGLLPLINYQKGHRLTEQIKALRRQIARELGFVMPAVRIQDNMQLPANNYILKIKEVDVGGGDIRPDMLLVMSPNGDKISLPGEETTEPTFGLPAVWINEQHREEALFRSLTVVDPPTVITTHLTEIIKENMSDLLSYAETQKLLDDMSEDHQKLISETIPSQITVTGIQRILQNLLGEYISIRDLNTIMEAVSEASRITQSVTMITEHVRTRLARQISNMCTNPDGYIPILALSPQWEQQFIEALAGEGDERNLNLAPSKIQEFITAVRTQFEQQNMQGEMPVLLTSPAIRPYVRSIVARFRRATAVISQNEIHPQAKIRTLGQL